MDVDAILPFIKSYLQVTWEDQDTDEQLRGLIEDGVAYLDDKLGAAGDYTVPGYPRVLLKEYVRDARDAALDVFENNYRSLLVGMQNNKAVSDYVKTLEGAETP